MERPEKTYTEILDQEAVTKIREEWLSEPLDLMDSASIEKKIQEDLSCKREVLEESMDKLLDLMEKAFIERDQNIAMFIRIMTHEGFFTDLIEEKDKGTIGEFYEKFKAALENKSIDEDEFLSFLGFYRGFLDKQQEFLRANYEILVGNFSKDFIENINPLLSVLFTDEDIKKNLNEHHVRIVDVLNAEYDAMASFSKVLSVNLRSLIADDDETEDGDFQHIFNHEAVHILSEGQAVSRVKFAKEVEENGDENLLYHVQGGSEWSGLQLTQYEGNRFKWLNEAVTETLSAISLKREPIAYPNDIHLFNLLCNQGISKIDPKLFYDAYFEKKGIVRDKSSERNFWNELMDTIDQSYPKIGKKKFLVYLDDVVKEKGITHAIEIMESRNF